MCRQIKFIGYVWIVLSFCFPSITYGQYVTEKIFLASDRTECNMGDTISVFGQIQPSLRSEGSMYSRYLYVEIFNEQDSVLLRKKLKSDDKGRFMADIPIATYWQPDDYYLRAYTRLMQNFSPLSFPMIPLQIGICPSESLQNTEKVNCHVYVEGGIALADIPQVYTIAFFDSDGNPVQAPFHILCEGDTLLQGNTTASGFQQVQLTLDKNKTYHASALFKGERFETIFPACKKGAALQVSHAKNRVHVRVLHSDDVEKVFRLFSYHDQLGMQEIKLSSQRQALIDTDGVPSGCLSFFLVDDSCCVLSERSVYIESDPIRPICQFDKICPSGSEYDFSFLIQDSMTVHARIFPEESVHIPVAETAFKWTSSLNSSLSFPVYYYRAAEEEKRNDLQAWLCTAQFIQFDVQKALRGEIKYKYPYEDCLTIRGEVKDENGLRMKRGVVNLFNVSNGKAYLCVLDDNGCFEAAVDDFDDGDEFFISALKGKQQKAGIYKYLLEDEVFPAIVRPVFVQERKEAQEVEVHLKDTKHYGIHKNNVLPEIRVKARIKHGNYIPTRRFYGNNYVDVANNEERFPTFRSIIDAMPFVELKNHVDYHSKTREYKIISTARGGGELVVLLDGSRVDANEVVHYSPEQIETVEFLTAHEALKLTFGAINGALVITTRKNTDKETEVETKGIRYRPLGITNLHSSFLPATKLKLPTIPGKYRLFIDCISSKETFSYEFPVEIN